MMNISKPVKTLIGLATLWYAIYPFMFMAGIFMSMGLMPILASSGNNEPPFFMFPFFALFPIHFCTIFVGMGLMVFYLVHVIKNTKADETVRIILGVGCFFMPFIAMPFYYYLYVWLDNPPEWAAVKVKNVE